MRCIGVSMRPFMVMIACICQTLLVLSMPCNLCAAQVTHCHRHGLNHVATEPELKLHGVRLRTPQLVAKEFSVVPLVPYGYYGLSNGLGR